jgi:hypothetical protein
MNARQKETLHDKNTVVLGTRDTLQHHVRMGEQVQLRER